MIRYELDGDLHRPRIVCDACGQTITGDGNAYWLQRPNGELHPGVWHTHKHPCSELDRAIEEQLGPGLVLFEELDCWLDQLRNNFAREVSP